MKVETKIGDTVVDALDLHELYDEIESIVEQRTDENYGRDALRTAAIHAGALAFAVHMKLGAISYLREQAGLVDMELLGLIDELGEALGLTEPFDEAPRIVTPA